MKEDFKIFTSSAVILASLMYAWVVIAGPAPSLPPLNLPTPTNSVMWTNCISRLMLTTNTCWSIQDGRDGIPELYRREVEDYWKNGTSNFPVTEIVNVITNYLSTDLFAFYAVTNLMMQSETNYYLPFQFKSADDVFEFVRTNKVAWSNYNEARIRE